MKRLDNSGHRSAIVCTYYNILGHTVDNCYKKERADRLASKTVAPSPSAQRSPSAYLTDGSEKEAQGVRYESAFMALA